MLKRSTYTLLVTFHYVAIVLIAISLVGSIRVGDLGGITAFSFLLGVWMCSLFFQISARRYQNEIKRLRVGMNTRNRKH